MAALHELDEILVGRRDESHVDPDRPLRANRIDLALLQRAQELHLQFERQLADLVEEQRAAVRLQELARVLFRGSGEGALLVAEEDRLDQIGWQRAAIDGHERLAAAIGGALNGARDDFLADARLALDEHRYGRTRGALAQSDDARHLGASRHEVLEGQNALGPARGATNLAGERIGRKRVLDGELQTFRADGLHDEVGGAGAHRRDDGFDRAMRRLHDDRRLQLLLAHFGEHAHAVEIGHDEIENEQRDRRRIRRLEAGQRELAAFDAFRLITEPTNHRLEEAPLHGIVIGYENRRSHRRPPP